MPKVISINTSEMPYVKPLSEQAIVSRFSYV